MRTKFYSQHGEDSIIWPLFRRQRHPGTFVEIGALEGMRFSNTYSFERAGWSGVCVEAHPKYYQMLKSNRPGSTCVHAAAGCSDRDSITFYINDRGTLSTLDPSLGDTFKETHTRYFHGHTKQSVPLRTLNTILDRAGMKGPIDVVSIDVEGTEADVIRGFDLGRFAPRVVIVELMIEERRQTIMQLMSNADYILARELGCNLIFTANQRDANVIAMAKPSRKLIVVPHPLDNNESSNQKRKTWLQRLRCLFNGDTGPASSTAPVSPQRRAAA